MKVNQGFISQKGDSQVRTREKLKWYVRYVNLTDVEIRKLCH